MDVYNEIIRWGKALYNNGYVRGLGGNLSIRVGDYIFIKRTGKCLGFLSKEDIVKVNIREFSKDASIDLKIHQEIYNNSSSLAIIHAHPAYTITISFYVNNFLRPIDLEGKYYIKEVPVIEGEHQSIYSKIGQLAKNYNIIVERGHGVYVHQKSLEQCFYLIEMLELSAKIYYLNLLISK